MHNNSEFNFWDQANAAYFLPISNAPVQSQPNVVDFLPSTQSYTSPQHTMPAISQDTQPPVVMGENATLVESFPAPMAPQQSATNASHFRRRRNWTDRILCEITGLLHVLSPVGKILYCSGSSMQLTGYTPAELVGKSITDYLHVDDIDVFVRDFHRAFAMQYKVQMIYRFRKKDDEYVVLETVGHFGMDTGTPTSQAFFAVSQAYPSGMNNVLDSLLELKMENEWLKRRLSEVSMLLERRESSVSSPAGTVQSADTGEDPQRSPVHAYNGMQPSPSVQGSGCQKRNLQGVYPMAAKEASAWMDVKVMASADFDGLLCPPPDTTTGISTLQRGLVSANPPSDLADPLRKDKWKRRKKQTSVDDYVCTDCGTTASPEWRKGPQGPKTLCNACGLRWAKKIKKKDSNTD